MLWHQLPYALPKKFRDPGVAFLFFRALAIIPFILINLPGVVVAEDLRSNISSWKKAFDVVSTEEPYVARVHNIFRQLKAVVGSEVLLSELYVLDSDNDPWAISLEDGNVILSRGALDIVYGGGVSLQAKDARMAFVLGHELNHVAKKDFWHEQVYRSFVSRNTDANEGIVKQDGSRRRESELRADEDGFIYASLAGFDTRELFTSIGSKSDFLHYWVMQTDTTADSHNHSARERVEFLSRGLQSLQASVEFFNYGSRLAHFGHYETARVLLDEFYKVYPSRQVLNNLGYVYLQLGREAMPAELKYRYWYPALLDQDSGLSRPTRAMDLTLPSTAKDYLDRAASLLKKAVETSSNDTTARKNLAIVYLYLGDFIAAWSILEEALKIDQADYQLLTLKMIAMVSDTSAGDQWNTPAGTQLMQLAVQSGAPSDLIYNVARLLELRALSDTADGLWSRLLERVDVPEAYRKFVCLYAADGQPCKTESAGYSVKPFLWMPPSGIGIEPGESIDDSKVKSELKRWGKPIKEFLGEIDATIYRHANGNSILVIDRIVSLITVKQHSFDFKQHLLQVNTEQSGIPLVETPFASSVVLSNGQAWAAMLHGEQIEEFWFDHKSAYGN